MSDDVAILRELNRVKVLFQLRAVTAALGIDGPTAMQLNARRPQQQEKETSVHGEASK